MTESYVLVMSGGMPHKLFESKEAADAYVDEMREDRVAQEFTTWYPVPVAEVSE